MLLALCLAVWVAVFGFLYLGRLLEWTFEVFLVLAVMGVPLTLAWYRAWHTSADLAYDFDPECLRVSSRGRLVSRVDWRQVESVNGYPKGAVLRVREPASRSRRGRALSLFLGTRTAEAQTWLKRLAARGGIRE